MTELSPIYKINHLVNNNKIDQIYVFYGDHNEKLDEIFIKDPMNELFSSIFSNEEQENIKLNKISVSFSKEKIHMDDSIGIVKIKILNEIMKINKKTISLEEIYLFCLKEELLNPLFVYESLTQNKKIELTKIRLDQFLLNIIRDGDTQKPIVFDIPEKNKYDYDDILSFNLNKSYWISKTIGQKYFIINNEYPYICNPYDVTEYDSLFEKVSRNLLTTLNSHLLLNSGNMIGNNIYLCLAEDVLENALKQDISQEYTLKIYYPFLYNKNINSLDDLNKEREKLIEDNKNIITKDTFENFKNINMFYDIYKERIQELDYKGKGIKYIKLTIHSDFTIKIPLEIIFKLIYTKESIPITKYNPSSRQENIYRLYTDKISKDGRKIPYLSKAVIFKLIKIMGKNKSVSVYINNEDTNLLICEFQENGNVTISIEFKNVVEINELNNIIKENVNPIINEIKSYLENNGYTINNYKDLYDENIEVNKLDYDIMIKIKEDVNLKKIKGCVSSIFVIESLNLKNDIQLRFKRVANFDKRTSKEAFIIEKQKEGYKIDELVELLLENYTDMKSNEAIELIAKLASELQVERGVRKNDIETKINPGFKVIIQLNALKSIITIHIEGINDIQYLNTIPIYIDSLIRLTQDKSSTNFSSKLIQKLCSSGEIKDIVIKDIIALSEERAEEQEFPFIKNEDNIEFQEYSEYEENEYVKDEDKMKTVMDLFFDDDFGENEDFSQGDNDFIGGKTTSDTSENSDNTSSNTSSDNTNSNHSNEKVNNKKDINAIDNVKNIDGMSLKNPYIFQKRLKERDPVLFLSKKKGKYNSYSRICPSNVRRQPVILTEEEKHKIEKDYPGFLKEEDIVKYGSNPEKPFYYICPRYWCLKTDSVISEEDVKAGKCGKIIPKDAKKVPKDHYVYDFYASNEKNKDFKQYPGFQVDKHPDGHCLPCCFTSWDTPEQLERRKICSGTSKAETKKEVEKEDEYIKGPEKFPLTPRRWGYLPISIQKFLHEVQSQASNLNQTNQPKLLRHGVELNDKQSFIACIADALYYKNEPEIPTIKEMKEIIIDSLSLDNFITFQNGNLPNDFHNTEIKIHLDKYSNAKIHSKLDLKKEYDLLYFTNIVRSYENFIRFLKDDDVIIDYTYLWDIICRPNEKLFKNGLNLVILEIANNDITNNIEMICPTNHYGSSFYESHKPTLIIIQQGDYFEPVYSYKDTANKTSIIKTFSEHSANIPSQLKSVIKNIIKPYIQSVCLPLKSMPNIYKTKTPLQLNKLIELLSRYNYSLIKQVVNYNNKVIGVIAKSDVGEKRKGFIPCYPSSIDTNNEYAFMIDHHLWNNYHNTLYFLDKVSKDTNGEIPCKVAFKVVEDEQIVGIITETNQFILLSEPFSLMNANDEIPIMENEDFVIKKEKQLISSEIPMILSEKVDTERIEYVKKIKLENGLFNAFRNTIRILLNHYDNTKIREKIEDLMEKEYILYSQKFETIYDLLKDMTKNNVLFVDSFDYQTLDEKSITTCITSKKDKCSSKGMLCRVTEKDECQLILPMKNLVTDKNNILFYYGKITDELIRYNRIKSFIFKPKVYLSFDNINYNLRENEIILLQSLITQEYFENLVPILINKYSKHKSYDEMEPSKSQTYENKIELEENMNLEKEEQRNCFPTIRDKIQSMKWKKCFPNEFKEIEYVNNYNYCSYYLVIDLVKKKLGQQLEVNDIKNDLYSEYKKYLINYKDKIVDILIIEGKKILGDQVKADKLSFSHFIYSDNYFLTTLDLWILMEKYKIPCYFISTRFLLQTDYLRNSFLCYGNREDSFAFIIVPGFRQENIPNFKLITSSKNNDIFFPLNTLKEEDCIKDLMFDIENKISIEEYLKKFTKTTTTTYKKKQPLKIID